MKKWHALCTIALCLAAFCPARPAETPSDTHLSALDIPVYTALPPYMTKLTHGPWRPDQPRYSPNGHYIAFTSGTIYDIWYERLEVRTTDGGLLSTWPAERVDLEGWSSDGRKLYFSFRTEAWSIPFARTWNREKGTERAATCEESRVLQEMELFPGGLPSPDHRGRILLQDDFHGPIIVTYGERWFKIPEDLPDDIQLPISDIVSEKISQDSYQCISRRLTLLEKELTWSPDSNRVACIYSGKATVLIDTSTQRGIKIWALFVYDVRSHERRLLCGGRKDIAQYCPELDFSPDGHKITFFRPEDDALCTVDVRSGTQRKLSDHGGCDPRFSPDGRYILYNDRHVFRVRVKDGRTVRLTDKGRNWNPRWSPDGQHIAYLRSDGLYIMDKTGDNKHLAVKAARADGRVRIYDFFTWSTEGDRILFRRTASPWKLPLLAWNSETYTVFPVSDRESASVPTPMVSPDGTMKILTPSTEDTGDATPRMSLRIEHLDSGKQERIVPAREGVRIEEPVWHPSGRWIAYTYAPSEEKSPAEDDGPFYIHAVNVKTGKDIRLLRGADPAFHPSGKVIVFSRKTPAFEGSRDLISCPLKKLGADELAE